VTFANALVDVGLDQIRSVLTQAAAVHGTYWDSPRLADEHTWLQPHTSGDLHTLFSHPDIVPALIRSEARTEPFKAEILSSIGQDVDGLYGQVQTVQAHQATRPQTVVHGDLHVGNTHYLPDGTGGLIDWQLTSRGRFIHDIGYFLVTSMPAAMRRANERALLAFYLDQLAATGVEAPTIDEAWDEYRESVAWSLYIGWLTTPVDNYGWSINVVNHVRLATAYRDLATAYAVAALQDGPSETP
jgi:thiamine kinase-like enzyme